MGANATSLRAKLTNPANFGPKGAYGNYKFEFVNVGNDFTRDTLVQRCNIWYSGYEESDSYTTDETTALQDWANNDNGQVIAGCDDATHAPVCELLGFGVTTSSDSYAFPARTAAENPIDCNRALGLTDQLNMAGGAGGYFSASPNLREAYVLAVHEVNAQPDQSQPVVIYTGNYFLTTDINMIQTGTDTDVTLSNGDEVETNNDFLAMNAFSALADTVHGRSVCSSVEQVGRIRVYNATSSGSSDQVKLLNDTTVELILDASGSMTSEALDSQGNPSTRIDVAKSVLRNVVNDVLPDNIPVAVRVLGEVGCNTELKTAVAPLDRAGVVTLIDGIAAVNGSTPIAASLAAVKDDLATASGPKVVVLVSDGAETCFPDPSAYDENSPLAAIIDLKESGFDVRINIVGYAIDDALRAKFQQWARAGGGDFYPADDAAGLQQAIQDALSVPYRITNDQGKEVATGVVGDPGHALPVGTYEVILQTSPPQMISIQVQKDIESGIGLIR